MFVCTQKLDTLCVLQTPVFALLFFCLCVRIALLYSTFVCVCVSDPSSVLQLLRAALSVDKLADLIKSEYHSDTTELETLQNRLEGSFTLVRWGRVIHVGWLCHNLYDRLVGLNDRLVGLYDRLVGLYDQ